MEVLRHLRPKGLKLLVAALVAAACAGPQSTATPLTPVVRGPQWPVKTREHVDLWLHGFALLVDDTATVPLYARGYRDQVTVAKNSRGLYTGFDSARASLTGSLKGRPALEGAQFIALYFGTWEEMKQALEYFERAEGDPTRSGNQEVQAIIAFLAQQFPRAEDRAFAKRFVTALDAERASFHHAWWLEEQRTAAGGFARADSLWQSTWRPAMQTYLNHTQQGNGDLIVSRALAGEGRSVPAGKDKSQYAVAWPRTADSAEVVLFSFAHEAAGAVAAVAINDHLTPAQQREGAGARYASAGLVRGGALLVERIDPALAERYARWYLALAGRTVPRTLALDALAAAFPMPDEMITSMRRQVAAAFSGI